MAHKALLVVGLLMPTLLLAPPVRAQVAAGDDGGAGVGDKREDEAKSEDPDAPPKKRQKKKKKKQPGPYSEVFAENWFDLASPSLEFSGYFRVRSQLFHNFTLGRRDSPSFDPLQDSGYPALWPQPPDNAYTDTNGETRAINLCGDSPEEQTPCESDVQGGANMRLRFEPTLRLGDNISVHSQLDMLDNIVLGSTPQGYANAPSGVGGYAVTARGGYFPIGTFAATQWAPVGGVTTEKDAVLVKRVWGVYHSPIGQISFGRMPHHWGLGMVHNGGDDYDADFASNVDRIMFSTGLPQYNLYASLAWDFFDEGAISSQLHSQQGSSAEVICADVPEGAERDRCVADYAGIGATPYEQDGQPYDLARIDDMDHWVLMVMYKTEEQLARRALALGDPVIAAGAYFSYQQQEIANDGADPQTGAALGQSPRDQSGGFVRRGYEAVLGDLWMQLRYRKFRVEVEAALLYGTLDNTLNSDSDFSNLRDSQNDGWVIQQFGLTTELDYRALSDRLRLGFGFGFATGDDDVASLTPAQSGQSASTMERQLTLDRTFSTFRFHPNYKIDLILWRSLMTRVQGAYYFRPSIEYDFFTDGCVREEGRGPCPGPAGLDPLDAGGGQRAGAGLTAIWSRASEPIQAPGHEPDLGVELNFKLYYQLTPGEVAPGVDEMGGFYTSLEYGVLFPLPGLDYLPAQVSAYSAQHGEELSTSPANTLRWFIGIIY